MFARVATFENALRPESVEHLRRQTVAAFNENRTDSRLDEGDEFPPIKGLLTLGDFANGRRLMITFWQTQDDLQRANQLYEKLSVPYAEARRVSLEFYEVIQADGFPAADA